MPHSPTLPMPGAGRLPRRRRRIGFSALCWLACAVAFRYGGPLEGAGELELAGFFAFLLTALSAVAQAIGVAGGAIATSLASAVAWLASQVAWLVLRVGNILVSTGSLFAKVWHWAERFYFNVIRPAFVWLYEKFSALSTWLRGKFAPVFDFLEKIRSKVLEIYDKFVQPVLDVISYTRAVLRVLARLGVEWAKALDEKLGQVESVITENFLRVLRQINAIENALERLITFDYLLQRFALIRSLDRDAAFWVRIWWNRQIVTGTTIPGRDRTKAKHSRRSVDQDVIELREYAVTEGGPLAPVVEELAATTLAMVRGAAIEEAD